jgi:hypothetical protein
MAPTHTCFIIRHRASGRIRTLVCKGCTVSHDDIVALAADGWDVEATPVTAHAHNVDGVRHFVHQLLNSDQPSQPTTKSAPVANILCVDTRILNRR